MKERRKRQRRVLSDRRWGGDRRRRERRTIGEDELDDLAKRRFTERRVAERRSGGERRVIRGRVLRDRRRATELNVAGASDPIQPVRARLDDDIKRVRPVIGIPPRAKTAHPLMRKRTLLIVGVTAFVVFVVMLLLLVLFG